MPKIDTKLMEKINVLENDIWEIDKVESEEEYMGEMKYRTVVIIKLVKRNRD